MIKGRPRSSAIADGNPMRPDGGPSTSEFDHSLTSVRPMGYSLAVRKRLSPWDMIHQELPNGTDTSRGTRPEPILKGG